MSVDSVDSVDLVRSWAEHAAVPFQRKSRTVVQQQLRLAVGTAIKTASRVMDGMSCVQFAYTWDDENVIAVEMDPEMFTEDMLVIRG